MEKHINKITLPVIFAEIWEERDHVSFLTGLQFPDYPVFGNFAHVLNRNVYPLYKYRKENIILLTYEEHILLDQGTAESRERYALITGCDWSKIERLREQLRQRYEAELKAGTYQKKVA